MESKWKENKRRKSEEKRRKGLEERGAGAGSSGERRRAGGLSRGSGARAGDGDTGARRCWADARTGARGLSPAGTLADTDSGVELVGSKRLLGEIKPGKDGGWRG